jgi:hypothetical protein
VKPPAKPRPLKTTKLVPIDRETHRNAVVLLNTFNEERYRQEELLTANERQDPAPIWANDLPPTTSELWRKMAVLVKDAGIHPEQYVRRHFDIVAPSKIPYAQDMATLQGIDKYQRAATLSLEEISFAINWQAQHLIGRIHFEMRPPGHRNSESACALCLCDPNLQMGAIFRYLSAKTMSLDSSVADRNQFKEIAEIFLVRASLMYIRDPEAYEKVWPNGTPKGFSEEARKIYRRVSGMCS